MAPADHKPPFPISPIRVRHRSVLRSSSISNAPPHSQIGSATKPKSMNVERSKLQSDFETISSELTKMVNKDENGKQAGKLKSSPLFERGRLYEEYSARRNERLKRKKSGEEGEDGSKTICDMSFVSEPVKKRNVKKFDDLNCSASKTKTPLLEINESVNPVPRYSLRSRTKMPPLPPSSVGIGGRKQAATRARKS